MIIDFIATALLVLAAPVAPTATDLPVAIVGKSAQSGELELALRPLAVTALLDRRRAMLAGFPLSDGSHVDLELERLDTARLRFDLRVDGARADGLLESIELSVWRGRVAGLDDSEVAISFSQAGVSGWVRAGDRLDHLVSRGDGRVWMFSEERRLALGGASGPTCASTAPHSNAASSRSVSNSNLGNRATGSPSLYACSIAVETDWQLNQVFAGNLSAEIAYVTSLLTWVSYRYELQIGTVLTYPYVQFYTNANDPWHSQDSGGNCLDLLYEFQPAWVGNIPTGANLAHFLSGANLGCGAAWIGGLCDPTLDFGVTGNIDGNNQFPIQVGPSNFNFYGVCHELGHNFNAIHTHDYCPPIDQCAPPGYFGPCQTQKVCTNQGTLMSYCHGCPGGFSNITTYFHPQSVTDMRDWVEAGCLPLYCADPLVYCTAKTNSAGCVPAIDWSGHPTLSGLDDFFVKANNVLNNKPGILLRSLTAGAAPFFGGVLCLQAPIIRTPAQMAGGTPPPGNDCSGAYSFHFSHSYMNAQSLPAGTQLYAQYWSRDPGLAVPNDAGLTNALAFVIVQ